jgi:hypothetical protein
LAERLKRHFPRLSICLLLDGLFAGGPTFDLCRRYGWKYIIVLKDLDLPSVNQEFDALSPLLPENTLPIRTGECGEIEQNFRWVNNIHYEDSFRKKHTLNVLECLETKLDNRGTLQTTKFKWITNFELNSYNVHIIANKGGRLRWKIENEGFNIQKNGGFELEHAYTKDENASKVFYFLMQIAHLIFQLIEKGSLLKHAFPKGFGSAKNIAFRLLEAWRNFRLEDVNLRQLISRRLQIRFDTS